MPLKFAPEVADRVIKAESVIVVCFYVDRLVILRLYLRGRLMEIHQNGEALGTVILYQKALSQAHLPEELSQSKRKALVFEGAEFTGVRQNIRNILVLCMLYV